MGIRHDPNLPEKFGYALLAGVRGLLKTQTTRLSPGLSDTARALAEIKVLRELIYQAEYELVARGQGAHDKGATWAEVAEASGHLTASAARRYFISEPVIRRARESRNRS